MSISAGPTAPPTVLFVAGKSLLALDVIHPVQMRGYLTLEISTSTTAFSVLENYEIDLAIVDLDMRDGLDGPRIATAIAANWPDVPMVVCAGSARTMQKVSHTLRCLSRPYDTPALVEAVDTLCPLPAATTTF